MKKARIENWRIITIDDLGQVLIGVVYDHPKIADGHNLLSSQIVENDAENSRILTKKTEYSLGDPLPNGSLPDPEFKDMLLTRFEQQARKAGYNSLSQKAKGEVKLWISVLLGYEG